METNSIKFFQAQDLQPLEHPPIVVAWQVKSPENVGSLMRLVDNVGGNQLILLDDENNKREATIKKTAGLSFKNVVLNYQSSEEFFGNIPKGYRVCAIETSTGATNIFCTALPEKIVFLLGSESKGLPEELLQKVDMSVFIPMTGKCKSMNISQALAVSLFEWQRQMMFGSYEL